MNAAERVENAYRLSTAGSDNNRDARAWRLLVELGVAAERSRADSDVWPSAALAEFNGAARAFAVTSGLPRNELVSFVLTLAFNRLTEEHAR